MDMKQLRFFLTICEKGSFTKAADTVFISQQALSASMSRLEEELKCSLFIRSSQGVLLTQEGIYFQAQAKKMLQLEKNTKQSLEGFHGVAPNLTIGCAYGVVGELADKLLNHTELMKRGIHLQIVEYPDIDCELAVQNGIVDLGLAIGPMDENLFFSDLLISRKYCFIAHTSHILAGCEKVSLEQLKGIDILMMNERFKANQILTSLCKERGFQPRFGYLVGELAPIQNLVLQQYGIGISADFVANKLNSPEIRTIYLDESSYNWSVYLIQKRNAPSSNITRAFHDYLLPHSDDRLRKNT